MNNVLYLFLYSTNTGAYKYSIILSTAEALIPVEVEAVSA